MCTLMLQEATDVLYRVCSVRSELRMYFHYCSVNLRASVFLFSSNQHKVLPCHILSTSLASIETLLRQCTDRYDCHAVEGEVDE